MHPLFYGAAVALLAAPTSQPAGRPAECAGRSVEVGQLRACLRSNDLTGRDLSGIDSLFNIADAPGFDAFDPDSVHASAGLNFEHIIGGHQNNRNAFTPRKGPYPLTRLADGKSVRLVRRAEDDPWKVSSTLTYTLREPHYIDFDFRCRVHDKSLFGPRGYGLFFFANYMNDVADPALHFRGLEEPGGSEKWIAAAAPPGPRDYNGGGTYRSLPAADLGLDADVSFRLNTWSYEWPRFTQPFYYGRAAHGMVYILMFDRLYSPEDEIRFSLFKFKLARFPRPAWDFQYVIHPVREGREYGFRGRAVWKKFVSQADCEWEYHRWAEGLPSATSSQPAG
jgi:hypothetical protein